MQVLVRGATRTQLRNLTALRTALAVCGNIARAISVSDGVLVEYEDPAQSERPPHYARHCTPPHTNARLHRIASRMGTPRRVSGRHTTHATARHRTPMHARIAPHRTWGPCAG